MTPHAFNTAPAASMIAMSAAMPTKSKSEVFDFAGCCLERSSNSAPWKAKLASPENGILSDNC